MTLVAPCIVNNVSCVKRINDECYFSWQAQYLVKCKCHFSWQAQYFYEIFCQPQTGKTKIGLLSFYYHFIYQVWYHVVII